MRNVIYVAMMLMIMIGCNSARNLDSGKTATAAINDTVRIANDSLDYEIVILDSGFSSWLATNAMPRDYHSISYLENKNRLWVMEYNRRVVQQQRFGNLYPMRIDYNPQTRYGYEVNYLLYNYLVYFQNANRQRLGGNVPSR